MEINIKKSLSECIDLSSECSSIICCSGGPDSVFLAHMISKFVMGKHHLLYFNHHQRLDEISQEIRIVEETALALNMACHVKYLEIFDNNQEGFRESRLRSLHEISNELSIKNVFLGHHLDDDIETFFGQLSKGATTNLKGISKITDFNEFKIIHPLLNINKNQIMAYLKENGLSFAIDSSNLSTKYTRNKFRMLIKDFSTIHNTKPETLLNSLRYLKSVNLDLQHTVDKVLNLKRSFVNHDLILKEDFFLLCKNPVIILKLFLELCYGQYVNKTQEQILSRNLFSCVFSKLELVDFVVEMDYKWISIRSYDYNYSFDEIKLIVNHVQPYKLISKINDSFNELGQFCCSSFVQQIESSKGLFCCDTKMVRDLYIRQINSKELKLKKKKKLFREAMISPIQQQFWPAVYFKDQLVWIPNVMTVESMGSICVSFNHNF